MKPRILITCKQMQIELPLHAQRLESLGFEVVAPEPPGQQFTARDLAPLMPGVVGMIAGDDELNKEFFDAGDDLRVVIRWGIGMDSVDHRAARERGVVVRNTPGVFGHEVADMAFGYLLSLARGIGSVDRTVREGGWPKFEGTTLGGGSLGVIGLGVIGQQVVARGRGFGMDLMAYDPYVAQGQQPEGVALCDLETLLSTCQFVVVTCPLTPETFHLLDATTLKLMRPDSFLVNVARGPVVDEASLIEVLRTGGLLGAALDVFEVEPLPAESDIREFPNVLLGSHNGSNTRQGVARASSAAVVSLVKELGL